MSTPDPQDRKDTMAESASGDPAAVPAAKRGPSVATRERRKGVLNPSGETPYLVVEDLDAYQANPEAYLAKANLPIKDPLLKDRRPRTEWKFEELAEAVKGMKGGRNFANGKQMFTVASCVSCHNLGGSGQSLGADLTKLDPKETPKDILRDILEPSFRINEKFQTWVIETDAGTLVTGLIVLGMAGFGVAVLANHLLSRTIAVLTGVAAAPPGRTRESSE